MTPEYPIVFSCFGDALVGIVHPGHSDARLGMVMVVGGPQYRVGSHRQYVAIARQLSLAGIPVLRFDTRGMGDSEGRQRSFDSIDEDIRAAIDSFTIQLPLVRHVVAFGLCDAASAILMYASRDSRISGIILQNPWARTEAGEAKAYVQHYYLRRVMQRSFWEKVLTGKVRFRDSILDFLRKISSARRLSDVENKPDTTAADSYLQRMETGFAKFDGPSLFLISGHDLTAAEFTDMTGRSRIWRESLNRSSVSVEKFPQADHTLSNSDDLTEVIRVILDWLRSTFC